MMRDYTYSIRYTVRGFDKLATENIVLRGVRVHNLQQVDLDLPHQQLVAFCGVSGSGKTSLALDTLYAEGQRRYIESFSAYTRQFLDRLEKPEADRIENIPPAIAVTRHHRSTALSNRSTVGTTTEITHYLRLMYSKIGHIYCDGCQREVRRETSQSVADEVLSWTSVGRYLVTFPISLESTKDTANLLRWLRQEGFLRIIVGDCMVNLSQSNEEIKFADQNIHQILVVVDRLSSKTTTPQRLRDSLELAFEQGLGHCFVLADHTENNPSSILIDDKTWFIHRFSRRLHCDPCGLNYPEPEPRLYSFGSPLGACPACEGSGNVNDVDMDLVIPNPTKTLRDGAVAPWNSPTHSHELDKLLALADDYEVPIDIPYQDLNSRSRSIVLNGVPEREFGGIKGFFESPQKRKHKKVLPGFMNRWRSYRICTTCGGSRLRPESLTAQICGWNIHDVCKTSIRNALNWFESLTLSGWEQNIAHMLCDQIIRRLWYLEKVGLDYLTLDRAIRTLSEGEAQRVGLTSALGSNLVNMLYVLDEPSVGLHPHDVGKLFDAVLALKRRGNTVIVVEHEETFLRAADHIVELGPGAGNQGGKIVFQGKADPMMTDEKSMTGAYLSHRRGSSIPKQRRSTNQGFLRITGARGNNLQNLRIDFPLGVLCLLTGVSGSGKSTLLHDTLYPAVANRLQRDAPKSLPFDDLFGIGQLEDAILIDQTPVGRSPRSNPVTYIKAFDEVRAVFAGTLEARTHNYTASYFSFNVNGGRCEKCEGDGLQRIDMQFMPDVYVKCDQCQGKRYRKEILDVKYRGRNISEVLEMTVREAFSFFRGQTKAQTKLKRLMDVGLEYLRLGQPANTLSSGEAQRLKLASYLGTVKRGRTLFLLDEPSTGLHFDDVVKLLDCFEALLSIGHSLIVVEHNLQFMKYADYIIDLGPGAADQGGQLVVQGTPEQVAAHPESVTGKVLAATFDELFHEYST